MPAPENPTISDSASSHRIGGYDFAIGFDDDQARLETEESPEVGSVLQGAIATAHFPNRVGLSGHEVLPTAVIGTG